MQILAALCRRRPAAGYLALQRGQRRDRSRRDRRSAPADHRHREPV